MASVRGFSSGDSTMIQTGLSLDGNTLKRGDVVDIHVGCALDGDKSCYDDYWKKLSEVILALADGESKISVMVEIWLDTGRIISIMEDHREFSRLVLTADDIERAYYDLPGDEDESFDNEYTCLYEQVREELEMSFPASLFSRLADVGIEVVVRDSDDIDTERSLFPSLG